ncbi:hypothetical protein Hanom_Chr11g01029351 [Helianthus anomalus]
MVHHQGQAQHPILHIHLNCLVARTKIHTRIHDSDTLDALDNMVHQQVESKPRSSLPTVYFDQQGMRDATSSSSLEFGLPDSS